MSAQILKNLYFSDLHIGQRGSRSEELAPRLKQEISKADNIIMGGDNIEMFYPFTSYEKAAEDGAEWLDGLLREYPLKQFFVLEGNHENCDLLRDKIYQLRGRPPFGESNLIWGRTYMNIGDGHFFHSDNEIARKPVEKRARRVVEHPLIRGVYERANISFEAPAMELMRRINKDEKVIDKIYNFLQESAPERLVGMNHAFFGHTHLPIQAMLRHGIKWYNSGSAAAFGKDNFQIFDLIMPETSEFRTDGDKRTFYQGARIENVRRVDLGGKYAEAVSNRAANESFAGLAR